MFGEEDQGLPIPELFFNTDTKAPMTHCIDCHHDLGLGDRYYMVEKIFKRYPELNTTEVLFEYAVCSECYEKMKDKLSEQSMAKLSEYMMIHMDFQAMQQRISDNPEDPEEWMTHCMIKGTATDQLNEYQIGACFKGDRLVTNFMPPFMIGGEAMEEMSALLSKETKDEMDGFLGDHFGVPPELRKDLILI